MTLFFFLVACAPEPLPLERISADPSEIPLPGLSADWEDRFNAGDGHFASAFRESQGLGPAYIRAACSSCHAEDSRGPGMQTRMVILEPDGVTPSADQSALPWGPLVRPYVAGGATMGVTIPENVEGLRVTNRIGPAVFGRGYIDAVADEEILRLESLQTGEISGRINYVNWDAETGSDSRFNTIEPGETGLIGRFGMKASFPTLDRFVAGAMQGDLSITSPYLPAELPNPEGLSDDLRPGPDADVELVTTLADYVRLLDIPHRDSPDNGGEELFAEIGCADCHVPSLRTRADYPVPQLANIDAPIYSDLLLHDRGTEMADGVEQGEASGREWRTAPLIGLRFLGSYLHDGRATTLREAIEDHAGEGSESNGSVTRFYSLSDSQQQDLLDWLATL